MARWGMIKFPPNYAKILGDLVRFDLFQQVATEMDIDFLPQSDAILTLSDGSTFDPSQPLANLNQYQQPVGLRQGSGIDANIRSNIL